MGFRALSGLGVVILTLLAGCTQAPVVSALQIDLSLGDQDRISSVEEIVSEMATDLGGKCRVIDVDRKLLQCSQFSYGELSTITSGFRRSGEFFVTVTSWGSPLFPPSKKELTSGSYLPDKHGEMEVWLFSSFSDFTELKKYRSYQGRDVRIEF